LLADQKRIETGRAKRKRTKQMSAYDYLSRGLDLHKSGNTFEETATRAAEMFAKAVEIDPGLARGHAWLACSLVRLWPEDWDEANVDECLIMVRNALSLDPDESEAHGIAGACHLHKRQYDKADYHIGRSLELNSNDAHVTVKASDYFSYVGRPERAQELVRRTMRLNPHHPDW
jgi:adenylate cyclase